MGAVRSQVCATSSSRLRSKTGSTLPSTIPWASTGTAGTGINNLGQIVGYYLDSNNFQHGYLYSNGTYLTLDDPLGSHGTVATGINDSGQIVGFYLDGSSSSARS